MASTLVESFELLVQAEQLAPRLDAAVTALAQLPGLDDEHRWLEAARARLAVGRDASHAALLDRALRLAELEAHKADRGKLLLQGAIADAVEKLQAGIAYAGGARAPLLDVLFHNLKIPVLRKATKAEVEKLCLELERRLASSYAKRMFGGEPYLAVMPTVHALEAAFATWRLVFLEPPLDGDAAATLRDELTAAGAKLELPLRQARLLAQAALLPTTDLLDAAGVLTAKAKRRGKEVDEDTHPILEQDPPPPLQPTTDELVEIVKIHAPS